MEVFDTSPYGLLCELELSGTQSSPYIRPRSPRRGVDV